MKDKTGNGNPAGLHAVVRGQASAQNGNAESVEHEAVLIISDDAEFARTIVGRWQMEPAVPAFTLMGSDLPSGATRAAGSVTIVGPRVHRLPAILASLEASDTSVICVTADGDSAALRAASPRVLFVRQNDGWCDMLVQLSAEVLRRCQAAGRLLRSEQLLNASNRHATLGKYMLEMRHGLNNCLTSVLGNAELLLLEPGTLSGEAREQVETIHTMALRMHEVMQRFSSLESEMQFAEKESHSETSELSHSHVSSS
ncbi:MAG TPA: histidine kinase dimerization/phospho-acceptor domain-containing protein [Terriglobales bacterium]|nr:histidine kinase dimerization/phospho-acceptor domain-containing protein [Terriglobales bacterium]